MAPLTVMEGDAAACPDGAQAAAAGVPEAAPCQRLRDSIRLPMKEEEVEAEAAGSVGSPLSDATTDASSGSERGSDAEQSSQEEETESECGSNSGEHRFTVEETLIIFDWDDTILPSTWVRKHNLKLDDTAPLSSQHQEELGELAQRAEATLLLAKKYGTVVLVTNAEEGWIELSCLRFMPSLYPLLMDTRLVSARTEYEQPDLPSPQDWKVRAFEAEIARVFGHEDANCRRKNILSVGDSVHEREAAIQTTAGLQNCCTKTLKFIERPTIEQVGHQHALVASSFERLVHEDGNLDLCVSLP